ncbi:MAG: hypothetical protein JWQ90_1429 [Hydrocarboniphaga sp.]|uniref:polysaccharide lyase family 7 protein n=1 Tax=Hydrocarboniphaga sp. TaxID=2033016 RepID=UPI002628DC9A|nr:polysaccharide lyase family 7 protein [Hydrocarboniphaga sp.]MDB5968979.1 hypothetical protein [Hydrocarboniphaga sp.]
MMLSFPGRRGKRGQLVVRCLILFSTALAFVLPARADLDSSLPPSGNFDLSHWKLTLPVDDAGGITGTAAEVKDLQGYSSPMFYTAADGGMVFWAPVNGATTDGSHYPRSELRETLDPASAATNWSDATNSVLEANLKVSQVPSTSGKVIVGQIHGYDVAPLVKLQFEGSGGKLTALINPTPTSSSPIKYTLATGLALDKAFYYRITVSSGVLSLSANGSTPLQYTIDPSWRNIGLYFKAGAYVQASGSSGTDGGQATFYRLSATHPDNRIAISTSSLSAASASGYYQQTLLLTGGLGEPAWSMASGRLPTGLSIDSTSGVIAGTPEPQTADGSTHSFTVQARDTAGDSVARSYTMTITP